MSTAQKVLSILEGYNLKKGKDNQYQCNSPLRAGSDSMAFTVKIEDDEHGTYHDFVSGESGSLYDLASKLGIATPIVSPVMDTMRKYSGITDYAKAHGLTIEILRAWYWREVNIDNRPALEFPTETGKRWRFVDGQKPKYKSETGYARCWYGFKIVVMNRIERGEPLIICNGEISTIAGQEAGLATISMTGGEKAELPPNLLEQLKGKVSHVPNLKIIVAMDCDKAGRSSGMGIASQLKENGLNAVAVDLGLGTGGDIADFCMLHGDKSLEELMKCKAITPNRHDTSDTKLYTIQEVMNLPSIEWLIPQMLPAKGLTMLYGASGTYKSFFALDIALKLASTKTVVYVAGEGESGYRQRLEAWFSHYKESPSSKKVFFKLGSIDMFDVSMMDEFARVLETYKPQLVIIDTLAMNSGEADENNGRDMLRIVRSCKQLSQELECNFTIVHHTNAEGKRERGSKVVRNACDTIIRVSRGDDEIIIESQKTKDTSPFAPLYLKQVVVGLGYKDNTGNDVSSLVLLPAKKVTNVDGLTDNQSKVLAHLAIEPNATLAEIADATEIDNRGNISKVISALVKKGYVKMIASGRELTEEGKKALSEFEAGVSTVSGVSGVSVTFPKNQNGKSEKGMETYETYGNMETQNYSDGITSQMALIEPRKKSHYEME